MRHLILSLALCGLVSGCGKGYNFSEAVYNAAKTQRNLDNPGAPTPPGDLNYQQYQSERKPQP